MSDEEGVVNELTRFRKTELSERERAILDLLEDHINIHGYPPTKREIGEAICVESSSLVSYYLQKLEKKGFIIHDSRVSQGIRLAVVEEGSQAGGASESTNCLVPVIGILHPRLRIPFFQQNTPILSDTSIEVYPLLIRCGQHRFFALQVADNSFVDMLFAPDDLLFCQSTERVENGELAVVWIESEQQTHLARIYYEGRRVRLQSVRGNGTLYPQYDVTVCAVVRMMLRLSEEGLKLPDFDLNFPSQVLVWFTDHPSEEPLVVGTTYQLIVAVVPENEDDPIAPFACSQYKASIRAENIEIKPHWLRPTNKIQSRMAIAEFDITPLQTGEIHLQVSIYSSMTWINELSVELSATDASASITEGNSR